MFYFTSNLIIVCRIFFILTALAFSIINKLNYTKISFHNWNKNSHLFKNLGLSKLWLNFSLKESSLCYNNKKYTRHVLIYESSKNTEVFNVPLFDCGINEGQFKISETIFALKKCLSPSLFFCSKAYSNMKIDYSNFLLKIYCWGKVQYKSIYIVHVAWRVNPIKIYKL